MARFEVTVSEMQKAANTISKAADEFRTAATNTLNAANTLADQWEGDSQVAFVAEQQKANDWYNKMMTIVDNYVTSLNNAAKAYQEADAQSASDIKSK